MKKYRAQKMTKEERYQKNLQIMIDAFRAALAAWKAGQRWPVSISKENTKMGPIASVSVLPLVTCPGCARETCGKNGCYAVKIACLRPAVAAAYARNTVYRLMDPRGFYSEIIEYVLITGCRFFRFHVSGEISRQIDADAIATVADICRHCTFLTFTKQYEMINDYIDRAGDLPDNWQVVFSAWKDLPMENPYDLPVAVVVEKGEKAPENAHICGGNCFECAAAGVGCWNLGRGEKVVFPKH